MTTKLSREEARQSLEANRDRERRTLAAKHQAEARELEDKYKAKFQLLDEIWTESSNENRTPPPEEVQETDAAQSNGSQNYPLSSALRTHAAVARRSVVNEVLIILDEMRGEIAEDEIVTQITVRERYEEKYPGSDSVNLRSRISHTLKQLSGDDGPLELVEKGAGSEPSKYRLRKRRGEAGLLDP